MSRLETAAPALTRGLAGAIRPTALPGVPGGLRPRLRRTMDAWPLALIALGGVLTLLWAGFLAWAVLRLAARLF